LTTASLRQQLSGKAASAILKKFLRLFGITSEEGSDKEITSERKPKIFPTPQEVRVIDVQTYRDAGLSYRKAEYLHSLADKFIDGSITSEGLLNMDDEEISKLLCSVKGIGQWTVDMFLMFDLKRPNILPVGDLGVRKGMSQHFQMKAGAKKGNKTKSSGPEEMIEAAQVWEPYRSIGAYYMWQLLDIKTVEKEK
ncbi:DNA glycosylase, partial [Fimicolochytrium jonesii]|uniref:DNA glycosylase n=1 Tax=Fimicolochytrium jonesii TaxID=1396493 RepID=UPI0022FF4416